MVNVTGVPKQLVPPVTNTGVTVTVATCVVAPELSVTKEAIFPLPLPSKPMLVLLLVQLKAVPGSEPVNVMAAVASPLHRVWLGTALIVGTGFTVIVKFLGVPGQLTPLLV